MVEKTSEIKENLLLIFVRNPELGRVKKRLAAKIGDEAALKVYEILLNHTASMTKDLHCQKIVFYSEKVEKGDIWQDEIFQKKKQHGQDLGERMKNAFDESFRAGFKNIIIIGSDLLELQKGDLEAAFLRLEKADFVIGPAEDGGYYLLGMKSLKSAIFEDIEWGTNTVFQKTIQKLGNVEVEILEEKNDIDDFEDVKDEPGFQKYLKNKI